MCSKIELKGSNNTSLYDFEEFGYNMFKAYFCTFKL